MPPNRPFNREPRKERLLALLSLPEFQYTPLKDPRQIRLFRLIPIPELSVQRLERSFALIEITMFSISLDKAPRYLALSYVWGDPALGKLIVCNEKRMLITKSLYRSLGTLSSCLDTKATNLWEQGQAIYLWADGICINQLDVEEKTWQVKLMGEIYRRAEGVVAHLGAPSVGDPRDALLSVIEWTKQFNDMVPIPEPKQGEDHYCPDWKSSPFSDRVAREFWSSVWFTRSWITQEFLLARDLVFLFGFGLNTAAWPWRLAVIAGLNLEDAPSKPPGFSSGRTEKEIKAMFRAQNQLSQWRSLKLRMGENSDGFDIVKVLARTNLTEATNPKDRIFSILGLLQEADRRAIRVDYTPEYSYRQLLVDVAAHCVCIGKTMEMINYAEHATEELNLPSWVSEWIIQSKNGLAPSLYKAAANTDEEVALEEHNSRLRIKGYIVDQLDTFGPGVAFPNLRLTGRWTTAEAVQNRKVSVLFEPDGCNSSHFIGVFIERAAAIMCQQLFLTHSQYPTGESAREVVRRVITCDQGWSGERSNAADGKQYTNHLLLFRSLKEINLPRNPNALDEYLWLEYSKCVGPGIGDTVPFMGTVLAVMAGNKLTVTKTGWFGVVPEDARFDDIIVIFKGGNTPFIVRADGNGQFCLIGACYIHGIMDGELFDEKAGLRRLEEGKTMDFVLC